MGSNSTTTENGIDQVLKSFAFLPSICGLLQEQGKQIAELRQELARSRATKDDADAWLDARGAAKYLCLSPGSFEKYRYKTTPRIKGYSLDGKTLYKRSDLDLFVRLYEFKSLEAA